jgi:hypothetical protein
LFLVREERSSLSFCFDFEVLYVGLTRRSDSPGLFFQGELPECTRAAAVIGFLGNEAVAVLRSRSSVLVSVRFAR